MYIKRKLHKLEYNFVKYLHIEHFFFFFAIFLRQNINNMSISKELLSQLLAATINFSGLPPIDISELPEFKIVSSEKLASMVCPDHPERCSSVAALFDTERYLVYLQDTLDLQNPMDNGFIVHELTHVLQLKSFGMEYFDSCQKIIKSEKKAYQVQNRYYADKGISWREGFSLNFMKCPAEEE